jgi:nucleoid DNA-binding protein
MAISKSDLIDAIITDSKDKDVASRAQIERIVNSVFDKITDYTEKGESVIITKFGTFKLSDRKGREYKTPKGEVITKPASKKLTFKSSKSLNEKFN